jgi:hypothetical protein
MPMAFLPEILITPRADFDGNVAIAAIVSLVL